jgi:hypothetical protein
VEREANIDRDTQNRWILGEKIPGVTYSMSQSVLVTSGPYAGSRGLLISLYSLRPEPLFHLESSDNEDFRVYQSEIRPANA